MSNAGQAATRPCSIDTDANAGGPVTSPARRRQAPSSRTVRSTTMFRRDRRQPRQHPVQGLRSCRRDPPRRRPCSIQRRPSPSRTTTRPHYRNRRMTGIDDDLPFPTRRRLLQQQRDLLVHELQQSRTALEQRHFAPERGKDGCVLARNRATANDDDAARPPGDRRRAVTSRHIQMVERHAGG